MNYSYANIFQRVRDYIKKREIKTSHIIEKFAALIKATGQRTTIHTPVINSLHNFIDQQYKTWIVLVFLLILPIFIALIFYQLQSINILKIHWYKDVFIHKMRGTSFFQQFNVLVSLYFVTDLVAVTFSTILLLFLSIIFRGLIDWFNTYIILSFITLVASTAIQGIGLFQLISDVYKSEIIVSEDQGSEQVLSATLNILLDFNKVNGRSKVKDFIVLVIITILLEIIIELISIYLLKQGVSFNDINHYMFLPRVLIIITFSIVTFSFLWEKGFCQIVNLTSKFLAKIVPEIVFIKKYLLRTIKKDKFFIFFSAILVTSFFAITTFADTLEQTYNRKRDFMYPYDLMIEVPEKSQTKSLIYNIPGISSITPVMIRKANVFPGIMSKLDVILLDANNFTDYLISYQPSVLNHMTPKTLKTLSESNNCIVPASTNVIVGERILFGIYIEGNLTYADLNIIAKTDYIPAIMS